MGLGTSKHFWGGVHLQGSTFIVAIFLSSKWLDFFVPLSSCPVLIDAKAAVRGVTPTSFWSLSGCQTSQSCFSSLPKEQTWKHWTVGIPLPPLHFIFLNKISPFYTSAKLVHWVHDKFITYLQCTSEELKYKKNTLKINIRTTNWPPLSSVMSNISSHHGNSSILARMLSPPVYSWFLIFLCLLNCNIATNHVLYLKIDIWSVFGSPDNWWPCPWCWISRVFYFTLISLTRPQMDTHELIIMVWGL